MGLTSDCEDLQQTNRFLDHLVGATEQHQRHRYAKRPGGLFLAVQPLRKPAIGWANQRS